MLILLIGKAGWSKSAVCEALGWVGCHWAPFARSLRDEGWNQVTRGCLAKWIMAPCPQSLARLRAVLTRPSPARNGQDGNVEIDTARSRLGVNR